MVDPAGIDRKKMQLPGEISVLVDNTEKSAEVIVPGVTSEDC